MSGQTFERLIRLEDEELNNNDAEVGHVDSEHLSDKDSCKVPMLPEDERNSTGGLENLFPGMKHKQKKTANSGPGIHFTLNGRHIHLNTEQVKYLSLITLTVQNAFLNLTMRAARTQSEQFSAPVAVTLAEFLKLITCTILICYEEASLEGAISSIKKNIIQNHVDTLKVAVPSFLYYIQNNLIYIASTHLDAATTQVTYQLKILTTAVFSVLMLNKKLSKLQWISLFILFAGVGLIETIVVSKHNDASAEEKSANQFNNSQPYTKISLEHGAEKPVIGFLAILLACCLSGFAGVYFEKILKNTSHVSLWIRNIQLAVVALPIGILQILFEYDQSANKSLLHGFTPLTWFCIALQAQGGLLVAVVVKFANNILKGFATSLAIVISTIASIFLFDFNLTPSFVFGATLVISSVMMYNKQ